MKIIGKIQILILIRIILLGSGCLRLDESITKTANTEAIGADILGRLLSGFFLGPPTFQAYLNTTSFLESNGDGNWTRIDYTGAPKLVDVAASGSMLIGVDGQTANTFYRSQDLGRTWTPVTLSPAITSNPKWIENCGTELLLTYDDGVSSARGRISTDGGQNWGTDFPIASATSPSTTAIACNNGHYYAVVSGSPGTFYHSTNPTGGWSPSAAPPSGAAEKMATNGPTVVVSYLTPSVVTSVSTDGGSNFGSVTAYPNVTRLPLAFDGFQFLNARYESVAQECRFGTSPDAINWTDSALNCSLTTHTFNSVAGRNGIIVAGGTLGGGAAPTYPLLVTSADNGVSWSEDTSPVSGIPGLSVGLVIVF